MGRMVARTTWMSGVLLLGIGGCLGRGQTDLLQARLREQQQLLVEAQSRLESTSRELKLARKETETLREQHASVGKPGLLPEQSDLLIRASGIRINTMLTAGFDKDDRAGDETLVVQFFPVDELGETVRLPGRVHIQAIDPKLPAGDQIVGQWEFSAEEAREHWVRGWLGTGYQFSLPWSEAPRNSELVVHVTLTSADGREFDATHLVKITPPVITADGTRVTPVTFETTRKPTAKVAPVDGPIPQPAPAAGRARLEDSSGWMRDDVPVYR